MAYKFKACIFVSYNLLSETGRTLEKTLIQHEADFFDAVQEAADKISEWAHEEEYNDENEWSSHTVVLNVLNKDGKPTYLTRWATSADSGGLYDIAEGIEKEGESVLKEFQVK